MKLTDLWTWLHVAGLLVWIGSILAVGVVILSRAADPKARGEIALSIYLRLAAPAFVVAFLAGVARLLSDPSFYLKQHHWMHPKLTVALVVIGLHHVIGGRAKKLARGTVQEAGPTAILTALIAALAALAAFFAIFKIPD